MRAAFMNLRRRCEQRVAHHRSWRRRREEQEGSGRRRQQQQDTRRMQQRQWQQQRSRRRPTVSSHMQLPAPPVPALLGVHPSLLVCCCTLRVS